MESNYKTERFIGFSRNNVIMNEYVFGAQGLDNLEQWGKWLGRMGDNIESILRTIEELSSASKKVEESFRTKADLEYLADTKKFLNFMRYSLDEDIRFIGDSTYIKIDNTWDDDDYTTVWYTITMYKDGHNGVVFEGSKCYNNAEYSEERLFKDLTEGLESDLAKPKLSEMPQVVKDLMRWHNDSTNLCQFFSDMVEDDVDFDEEESHEYVSIYGWKWGDAMDAIGELAETHPNVADYVTWDEGGMIWGGFHSAFNHVEEVK